MKNQQLQPLENIIAQLQQVYSLANQAGVSTLALPEENLLDIKIREKMNERRRFLMKKRRF